MGIFAGLFGSLRHERIGFVLYGQAVAAARVPYLYETIGAPDTLDGRFDLVGLHAFLVIRRLRQLPAPGAALAQAVFDAMFSDMDVTLREIGVGDLSVGRKVKLMWEAFHGRAAAYQAALDGANGDLATTARPGGEPTHALPGDEPGNALPGDEPTNALPGDNDALSAVLARNVWRGAAPDARSDALARIVRAQDHALATQTLADFRAGRVAFLPAMEVA